MHYVNCMYAGALLMHQGSHFNSLIGAVPKWLRPRFYIEPWPPDEQDLVTHRHVFDLLKGRLEIDGDGVRHYGPTPEQEEFMDFSQARGQIPRGPFTSAEVASALTARVTQTRHSSTDVT